MPSRPLCIRCNRPIKDGQLRQSRMGASKRSYWHATEADCLDTGLHRRRAPNRKREEEREA